MKRSPGQRVLDAELSLTARGHDRLSLGFDYYLYGWIGEAHGLCADIRDAIEPLFDAQLVNPSANEYLLTISKLGRRVLKWIESGSMYSRLLQEFPQEAATLELSLHFRAMAELLDAVEPAEASAIARSRNLRFCADHIKRLNAAVTTCRTLQSTSGFMRELRRRRRYERLTKQSMLQYIMRLHALHVKLLVIRVDLHYRFDPALSQIGPRPSIDRVMRNRDELVRIVRKWAKGNLLGYVVRSEFAFYKCRIPDDCIDPKRYPLFMARDVLKALVQSIASSGRA